MKPRSLVFRTFLLSYIGHNFLKDVIWVRSQRLAKKTDCLQLFNLKIFEYTEIIHKILILVALKGIFGGGLKKKKNWYRKWISLWVKVNNEKMEIKLQQKNESKILTVLEPNTDHFKNCSSKTLRQSTYFVFREREVTSYMTFFSPYTQKKKKQKKRDSIYFSFFKLNCHLNRILFLWAWKKPRI